MHPVNRLWYAVYTCSRAEKKVAHELHKIGVEHYLPLITTLRQWSDRKKRVEVPLISSYVFVHVTSRDYLPVLQIPGVVNIVHFCGEPASIPDWQIDNLKTLMRCTIPVSRNGRKFVKGEKVRISTGSLTGLRGTVACIKGRRGLVIHISALDYNLSVDIDPLWVETA